MTEGDEIFPEYLTDVHVLRCPGSAPHALIAPPWKADDVTDESYFYLGWAVTTEEEGLALLEAYESLKLSERDADIEVGEGKGNVGGKVFFRLREGIERFLITDINQPAAPPNLQSKIPLIWDRLGNHMPDGGNVLYMDGHVEFVKYPGKFPMTERFMTALEALADSG
jgi:prepilin-type processing-associated H-X9-DG protein